MHDPAFKTVFCHPTAIERLVRRYAAEHADRIDFSTLTKMDAELVGDTLVRRYPDMLWMAEVSDGDGRVVIQLEFQGDWDWLMKLRMAIYQLMTAQQIFQRKPSLRREGSLEVLSFVIYHGRGTGKGAVGLRKLFPRWAAGEYRLIARHGSGFEGDLAQTVLALELDRSVEGTQAVLAELTRIAERTGSDYAGLMAEGVAEMLISTGRITREQVREAKTMAEVTTTYQQSLEEYGRRHFREGRDEGHRQGRDEGIRVGRDEGIRVGRDEGIRVGRDEGHRQGRHEGIRVGRHEGIRVGRDEGQVALLRQLVLKKFGPEAAKALSPILGGTSDSKRTDAVASAMLESASADEFLARLRSL